MRRSELSPTPKSSRRARSRSTPRKTSQTKDNHRTLQGVSFCWWYLEKAAKAIPVICLQSGNTDWKSDVKSVANDMNDGQKLHHMCSEVSIPASPFKYEVLAYQSQRDNEVWFAGSASNRSDRERAASLAALVVHQMPLPTWCPDNLRVLVEHLRRIYIETCTHPRTNKFAEESVELQSLRTKASNQESLIEEYAKDCERNFARAERVEEKLGIAKEDLWVESYEHAKSLISLDRVQMHAIKPGPQQQDVATRLSALDDLVYIGGYDAARQTKFLQDKDITRILNVSSEKTQEMSGVYAVCRVEVLHLKLVDTPLEDILGVLESAHRFLDEALCNHRRVLVHCKEGRNRSAAIVVSFLMRNICRDTKSFWKHPARALNLFWDALGKIAADRWPILTQESFRFQLVLWALHRFHAEEVRRDRIWQALRCHCCILAKLREQLNANRKQLGNDVILQYADRLTEKCRRGIARVDPTTGKERRDKFWKQITMSVNKYLGEKDSAYSSSEDFEDE